MKCLQYISTKFVKGGAEVFTKESEELIISETKKLLSVNILKNIQLPQIKQINILYSYRMLLPTSFNNVFRS